MNSSPNDRIVTSAQLSAILGISRTSISRYAQAGIIFPAEGYGQYRFVASVQGYLGYLKEQAEARAEPSTTDKLRTAQLRLLTEKANGAALANEKLRAEFVWQTDVEFTWNTMDRDIRAGLLSLIPRLQRRLPQLSAIDLAVMEAEVRDALKILDTDAPRFLPSRAQPNSKLN